MSSTGVMVMVKGASQMVNSQMISKERPQAVQCAAGTAAKVREEGRRGRNSRWPNEVLDTYIGSDMNAWRTCLTAKWRSQAPPGKTSAGRVRVAVSGRSASGSQSNGTCP